MRSCGSAAAVAPTSPAGTAPSSSAQGSCCATLPLISPLDTADDRFLISAHMLEHVLIGDASPALLLLAVRGPLVFFMLPDYALRWLARFGALRSLCSASCCGPA